MIVNTHAIDPQQLIEFFGSLSAEWALDCLKVCVPCVPCVGCVCARRLYVRVCVCVRLVCVALSRARARLPQGVGCCVPCVCRVRVCWSASGVGGHSHLPTSSLPTLHHHVNSLNHAPPPTPSRAPHSVSQELLSSNMQQNLQLVVQVAKEYTEQLGAPQIIALLEAHQSYHGLYFYLGSCIAFSEDPEARACVRASVLCACRVCVCFTASSRLWLARSHRCTHVCVLGVCVCPYPPPP